MMGERAEKEAFVTLATNDTYALGCLVLGNSLRRVRTTRKVVVMVTDGVSLSMRNQLGRVFDVIQDVNVFDSNDAVNLQLLGRPDLSCTLTKLHCWKLTQFQKCVFMDADTLVLQNVDELFDREELSAAPDAGWPDCFNSGVFVFVPSVETYDALEQFAMTQGTFDGGDQGLLNLYFHDWSTQDIGKHLPFIYNVVSQAFYSYLPAFTQFKDRIKIVHFIGAVKPWHHAFNTATGTVMPLPGTGHSQEFLQQWWNIFMETVQPMLDPAIGGLVGELASLQLEGGIGASGSIIYLDDRERKLAWERGQMDYLGVDKFENIQKKLDEKIGADQSSKKTSPPPPSKPVEVEAKPVEEPPESTTPAPKSGTESTPSTEDSVVDADFGVSFETDVTVGDPENVILDSTPVVADAPAEFSFTPVAIVDTPLASEASGEEESVANVVLSAPIEETTSVTIAAVQGSAPSVSDTFTLQQPAPEPELPSPPPSETVSVPDVVPEHPLNLEIPSQTSYTETEPVPSHIPEPEPEPALTPASEPVPTVPASKPAPVPKPTTPEPASKPTPPAPAPKPTTPSSPVTAPPAPAPQPAKPEPASKPTPPAPAPKPTSPATAPAPAPERKPWEKPKPWEKTVPAQKPAPAVAPKPTAAVQESKPAATPEPAPEPKAPESKAAARTAPFSRIAASPFMKSAGSASSGVYAPKPWSSSGAKQYGSVTGPKTGAAPAPAPAPAPKSSPAAPTTAPKPTAPAPAPKPGAPAAPPKPSASRFGSYYPPAKK